jgi:hypothetical protein
MARPGVVADMSETLLNVLKSGLPPAVPPANVLLSTPDDYKDFTTTPAITVFLYYIGINGEARNGPPRLLSDGTRSRPFLPIELRYLITPWASKPADAHLILGYALQVLSGFAAMSRGQLSGSSWDDDDTVQLLPESLPVDTYHDIWEPSEIPYKLSISYLVRILGIEPLATEAVPPVISASFTGPLP